MSRNNRWIFTTTEVVSFGIRMVNVKSPLVSMKSGQGRREWVLVESRALVACCTRFKLHASLAPYAHLRYKYKIPIKTELQAENSSSVFCSHHGTNILYQFNYTSFSRLDTFRGYLTPKWCSAFQLYCRHLRPYIHNTAGKETQLYEMWTKDLCKLIKLASAILDVTVNYSDVVVTTVFSVSYNQTFNHCLRGFPSVVASVFPLVYFRFINPKYVFVRRLVGVLFGYVVTIGHFEVLPETGSVLCRIALWDFRDAIPFFCYDVKSAKETGSISCPQSNPIVQFDITPT